MERRQFERIGRALTSAAPRRGVLSGAGALGLTGLLARLTGEEAAGKRKKKKKAKPGNAGPSGPPGPPGPPGVGSCPADTTFFGGAGCVENAVRSEVDFNTASATCAAAGRRLLTSAELDAFRQQPGVTIGDSGSAQEWTGTFLNNSTALVINGSGGRFEVAMTLTFAFRCLTVPAI